MRNINDGMKNKIIKSIAAVLAAVLLMVFGGAALAAGVSNAADPIYAAADQFSDRDMEQEANTDEAVILTVKSGEDTLITAAGVYVISGEAENAVIRVEAGKDDKVQLVLDSVSITNTNQPCIYVVSADKVFVTLAGENSLSVTGSFVSDGSSNPDAVIFSKQDLVLNGTGSASLSSTDNGVAGKDDLKITGGTWTIQAKSKAVEANDSIRIAGGTLALTAGTDGLHAENDDDDEKGYIFISGGELNITAGDDAVHAVTVFQIDGGSLTASGAEGIEATVIQINGGTISIHASDDGMNAGQKSNAYTPAIIFNGGETTVAVGAGDTDGVDSNGDIIINGGTVSVTGNSAFDYDGTAAYNGGTIIVNGQQVNSIPNQMMGGGRGGWGNQGGFGNQGGWGNQGNQGGWGNSGGGRGGRGGW